jgi:hypothetical protein
MASYNYGNERKVADSNMLRQQNFRNFQEASKNPESFKRYVDLQEGRTQGQGTGQVEGSFNRMMNIGQIGDLGGKMGSLERASMRLAESASQRRMGETEKEYGLRGGLLEKEYGLKDISMGKEYGLRDISTEKEYGLKGGLLEKEYGLKTPLMRAEYEEQKKLKEIPSLAERASYLSASSQAAAQRAAIPRSRGTLVRV